jgi:alkaline phosphatase D
VTDRSVRVWLRSPTAGPRVAALRVADRVVAEAALQPDPARDHVAVADLTFDRPAPNAPFVVDVAGMTRRGRFAPAPGQRTPFSFAFGSCHYPYAATPAGTLVERPAAAWYPSLARVLRARGARFLALLGDQVYVDALPPIDVRGALHQRYARDGRLPPLAAVVDAYRQVYRGYFNQPGFRALQEEWPTYLLWDDHEILDNWGASEPDELDRHLFRGAAQVYREYQHSRNPGGSLDGEPPYDYSFWYGDVGFFALDARGARHASTGVVLGSPQWLALEAFLAAADERNVPTVFVAASVPVIHFSPALIALGQRLPGGHQAGVRDRWSAPANRGERDALLERLFEWQTARPSRQVILLSGDVHAGAIFRVERPRAAGRLWQWTSSALTTPLTRFLRLANTLGTALVQVGEWRYQVTREALVPLNNCGLVDVTPIPGGGHLVDLRLCASSPWGRSLRVAARVTARPVR